MTNYNLLCIPAYIKRTRATRSSTIVSSHINLHGIIAHGSVDCYKVHLVAKGFKQRLGIDYDDTFNPVFMPATIHLILSLTTSQDWDLRLVDVKNAFFHDILEEHVYMKKPPGFSCSEFPSYDYKLDKALYSLKQAPRAWYSRVSEKLHSLDFSPSKADVSLFHYNKGPIKMFLLLYIDDIKIASSLSNATTALLRTLQADFALTDFGSLHYFLGIEVSWSPDGLYLSQQKYTIDLLRRAGMTACKPAPTLLSSSFNILAHDGDPLGPDDATKYHIIVGALQYLTLTHVDISFMVNKVNTVIHWRSQSGGMGVQWDTVASLFIIVHQSL
jgi:hypothetical protein